MNYPRLIKNVLICNFLIILGNKVKTKSYNLIAKIKNKNFLLKKKTKTKLKKKSVNNRCFSVSGNK